MKLHTLSLPKGDVSFLGAPLDVGPLPALIYFTMSHRDSLLQAPYNQFLLPLLGGPFRIFSWDLPHHPVGVKPDAGIEAWEEAYHRGENFIDDFLETSTSHLASLKEMGAFIDGQVIASGLSRGAFAALHLAAESPLVHGVVAFAPLVQFYELHLGTKISSLASKWIKGFISFHDERVHTERVISLFSALSEHAKQAKVVSPKISLSLYPSIGYKGHGTPEEIFLEGGTAVLKKFSP